MYLDCGGLLGLGLGQASYSGGEETVLVTLAEDGEEDGSGAAMQSALQEGRVLSSAVLLT